MRPATIKIFLVDGDPDGLRIATKSNWTGEAIVCPRARFAGAKSRKEYGRPGVYVLVTPSSEDGTPSIYVGEGDPVKPRLEDHHRNREFWTSVIAFTSSSDSLNMNKAQVQYLEARLIELAKDAKRYHLENKNAPALPSLPEADQAEMEVFLEEMLLVYPILGVSAFEMIKVESANARRLFIRAKGITASGYDTPAGFVVTRGSEAVTTWTPSAHKYAVRLQETLVKSGVLELQGERYVFTQDYAFDSPSGAAQVIQGRTANGRIDWKDEQGTTLKQIQEMGDVPSGRA